MSYSKLDHHVFHNFRRSVANVRADVVAGQESKKEGVKRGNSSGEAGSWAAAQYVQAEQNACIRACTNAYSATMLTSPMRKAAVR